MKNGEGSEEAGQGRGFLCASLDDTGDLMGCSEIYRILAESIHISLEESTCRRYVGSRPLSAEAGFYPQIFPFLPPKRSSDESTLPVRQAPHSIIGACSLQSGMPLDQSHTLLRAHVSAPGQKTLRWRAAGARKMVSDRQH